jgi:cytochrome c oxidase subunit 2
VAGRAARSGVAVLCGLMLAGCGAGAQSALAPKSHQARDIASLFWWMTGVAVVGVAIVTGLLLLAWKRRNRVGAGGDTEGDKPGERLAWYVVVGAGIVTPIALVATLFVISDIFVIGATEAPAQGKTELTIDVTGHQWWWEARYAGTRAVTANEIHIPVRTSVRIVARTADVIHSFWVPQLNRKIDTIPGAANAIGLYADAVGRYRGQCAEFCGLEHAHMSVYVIAQTRADFDRWLAAQSRPASSPASAAALAGEKVFMEGPCASCHAIRGTGADGYVGPDLTHLQSRTTIAALMIPNTDSSLRRWILDSQRIKPGNQMPDFNLDGTRLNDLLAYLEGLR